MSLIVENGSKPAGANSYISAADATAYLTTYNPAGLDAWPSDQPSQEQALIAACQAMEMIYAQQYDSFRILSPQSLLWPRYPFYDKNARLINATDIPYQLGWAQTEMAVLYLNGYDMFPNEIAQGSVIEQWDRIDTIQTRTRYKDHRDYKLFPKIDLILDPILKQKYANKMSR